jgi:hypothetical protein
VYYYDESTPYSGNGTIKIGGLPVGTVTGGKLTAFELPSTDATTALIESMESDAEPINWEWYGLDAENVDGKAQIYDYDIDFFHTNGEKIGKLLFKKTAGDISHVVQYWYFDDACEINAAYDGKGLTVSIDAAQGWNRVYQYETELTWTITTDITGIPGDLKWVFEDSRIDVFGEDVYDEDGVAYTGTGNVKVVDSFVGGVDSGKLTFTLPLPWENEAFAEVLESGTIKWDDRVTVTNGANAYGIQLDLFSDVTLIGTLSLEKTDGATFHKIEYMYFDKACTVNGYMPLPDDGDAGLVTVSIDAHRGWNKLYQYRTTESSTLTTNLSSLPTGLKWVVEEIEDEDEDS